MDNSPSHPRDRPHKRWGAHVTSFVVLYYCIVNWDEVSRTTFSLRQRSSMSFCSSWSTRSYSFSLSVLSLCIFRLMAFIVWNAAILPPTDDLPLCLSLLRSTQKQQSRSKRLDDSRWLTVRATAAAEDADWEDVTSRADTDEACTMTWYSSGAAAGAGRLLRRRRHMLTLLASDEITISTITSLWILRAELTSGPSFVTHHTADLLTHWPTGTA